MQFRQLFPQETAASFRFAAEFAARLRRATERFTEKRKP
jgi:hypothetical protein